MQNKKTKNWKLMAAVSMITCIFVATAYSDVPNPGHSASQIGSGTFYGSASDVWSFPGSVGIGTVSPENSLHVAGSTGIKSNYGLTIGNSGGWSSILLTAEAADKYWYIFSAHGGYGSNDLVLRRSDNNETKTVQLFGNLYVGKYASSTSLYVDNGNGRVGIGTTGPTYKFEIAGTAGSGGVARIGSTDYGTVQVLSVAPGTVYFDAPGVVGGRMTILGSNGYVGIGTAAPSYNLHVVGDIYASGNITCGGSNCGVGGGNVSGGYWNLSGSSLYPVSTSYNVGIGTTTPVSNAKLTITQSGTGNINERLENANGGAMLQLSDTVDYASYLGINPTTNFMWLGQDYTNQDDLVILNTGNVGIGTTAPATTLDVAGTFRSTTWATPTSGVGLEIGYWSNSGLIQAYDRSGDTTRPLLFNPNGGNVGIGTTTPNLRLSVYGAYGYPAASGTTQTGTVRMETLSNNVLDFGSAGVSPYGSWIQSTDRSALGTYYPLLLNPNGGNVGIGTAAPDGKLDVETPEYTWGVSLLRSGTRVGGLHSNGGILHLQAASGGAYVAVANNGNVGIGTTTPNAPLQIAGGTASNVASLIDNNKWYSGLANDGGAVRLIGIGSVSNDVYLGAVDNAAGKVIIREDGTDKVTINGGNVGIGTTSPGYTLTVSGTAWVTSGTWSGSDVRWKKNITPLNGSLGKVLSLKPVSFVWRNDTNMSFPDGTQVGFIAQDVEKVLPEVVTEDNNGYKGISYERITPLLTGAVQDQQKQIDKLKAENGELKALVCMDHPGAEVCGGIPGV